MMRALLIAGLLLAAGPAFAQISPIPAGSGLTASGLAGGPATLRPQVVADEATLRLGDLFDGQLEHPEAPLGLAPAPGQRMVLETAQIMAVARAHKVLWRPLTGQERVVIERPGRPVAREEVVDIIRADLLRLGLEEDAEPEFPGFVPPMVPLGAFVQLAAEQVYFDQATNRFSATLVVAADGMTTLRLRIAGRTVRTEPMVVAVRRLTLGEVVAPGDVEVVRVPAGRVRPGVTQALDQVVGQQLRRPVGPKMPVSLGDIGAPVVVEKNSLVTMTLDAPGLVLTTQGKALEAGGRGQVIAVMNLASRSVVEAVATGPGRVRVAFGSAPVREQQLSPTAAVAARTAMR
ncbi:flagellar basal body P-ring formation protein FlgA [Acetobacteraceae bacterium H6797]|nr:flagellar basal body P-ring formation protein FlgA [Acetobacteraceae bacterium H6797]